MNTYVRAALDLVEKGSASEGEKAALQDAVRRALEAGSKDEGAWIMRRSFDSILSGAVAARESAARVAASAGPGGEFEVRCWRQGVQRMWGVGVGMKLEPVGRHGPVWYRRTRRVCL